MRSGELGAAEPELAEEGGEGVFAFDLQAGDLEGVVAEAGQAGLDGAGGGEAGAVDGGDAAGIELAEGVGEGRDRGAQQGFEVLARAADLGVEVVRLRGGQRGVGAGVGADRYSVAAQLLDLRLA